jgi:hypothetical protein
MRRYITVLAILVAPLLHAATFRFDPPVPTNDTTTKLTFFGSWPDGCPSKTPVVTVGASRIDLVFPRSQTPCPAVITPFSATVNFGLLPAGVYDVSAYISTTDFPYVLGATRLVVRDVTTFTISPAVGRIGTHVTIAGKEPFDVEPLHVFFGGVEAPVVRRIDDKTIEVTAPSVPAGPVSVVVESVMGGRREAPAAFTFVSPIELDPDPFTYTQLLFPIDFAGPGAFGSVWTTENYFETSDGGEKKLPVLGIASGRVVTVLRSEFVSANSRVKDLSRSALTAGTEVPVVRETDFRERLRLLDIPTGANLRALLRVWTRDERVTTFTLNIDQIPTFAPQLVPMRPAEGDGGLFFNYGTFDLTSFLHSPIEHLDLSAGVPQGTRIWGMISITNNDTQQVTIVSPQ